jgi:hypothetical protein
MIIQARCWWCRYVVRHGGQGRFQPTFFSCVGFDSGVRRTWCGSGIVSENSHHFREHEAFYGISAHRVLQIIELCERVIGAIAMSGVIAK